jgi:phosphoribosyl 1,2-cyclic phosphate phosphodiesterase
MEIIFLGTGPAINIPRKGCKCLTCKDARKPKSKSKRLNSSILISHKRGSILIDCTPNFINQFSTKLLKEAKIQKLDAIFLTHAHKDASGGLKGLSKFVQKQKKQITLFIHKETFKKLKSKIQNLNSNIQIKLIKPYQTIKLSNFKIVSFPVYHGLKKYPTFGYLINNKIIYASDMKGCPKKSLKYFKKTQILILDASMWFGKKIKGHFNVEEAIKFAQKMRVKKIYLTHLGHTFPPHEKAQKQINQYLKKEKSSIKVKLAFDGMKFKI